MVDCQNDDISEVVVQQTHSTPPTSSKQRAQATDRRLAASRTPLQQCGLGKGR